MQNEDVSNILEQKGAFNVAITVVYTPADQTFRAVITGKVNRTINRDGNATRAIIPDDFILIITGKAKFTGGRPTIDDTVPFTIDVP